MSSQRGESQGFWDAHYTGHHDVWGGTPNAVLVDEAGDLRPGRALDLGCGEGADAIWLARRGWQVTAVDVSPVALARAADHGRAAGVAGRITWAQHDLDEAFPAGSYDLVTAHYLHSPHQRQHQRVLEHAVRAVAACGTLLLVGHASVAPWSWDQDARFPTAADVLASLALPAHSWMVAVCDDRPRHATGPNGDTATVIDSVVRASRTT